MLEIRIHCPGNTEYLPFAEGSSIALKEGQMLSAGNHDLVTMIAQPTDFASILKEEVSRTGRGRLVVSGECRNENGDTLFTDITVCVDRESRAKLRESIKPHLDDDIRYYEPDFQPPDKARRTFLLD